MKLVLWAIGPTREPWITEGTEIYLRRLARYVPFEYKEWPLPKGKRHAGPEQQLADEAEMILSRLKPNDKLMLLDENGKEMSSAELARWLDIQLPRTAGNFIFLIGGAYGLHKSLRARAEGKISLSRLTFTHQMARLIAAEALYRAFTIIKGEPYHHE